MTIENDPNDIRIFAEKLAQIGLKDCTVPELRIPNWPRAAGEIRIDLGKRDFVLPVRTEDSGPLEMEKGRNKLRFIIKNDGIFCCERVTLNYDYRYGSDGSGYGDSAELIRMQTLSLFTQFRREICEKVIQYLENKKDGHNEVVEMTEKALEPFIPFLVADGLAE